MKRPFEKLRNKQGIKALEKFKNDFRFDLNHEYGFSVNGKIVSEFGYLLRYITQQKIDTFNDFELIAREIELIQSGIEVEMKKEIPRETEVGFISVSGAKRNLENLLKIVDAITKYVVLAKRYDFPKNPLLANLVT